MALRFGKQLPRRTRVDMQCIVNWRQVLHGELNIDHGTPEGDETSLWHEGGS